MDYDELKHLIKERTTSTKATPVSIPGQGDSRATRWNELDDELFLYLYDQHDRVSLFSKSKFGEIQRRLNHLDRQLQQLGKQRRDTSQRSLIQQSRRFQKVVVDAEAIGEEIQSLSRYSNTQKIAFKKILKKYRKWTESSRLEMRMNNEVFNHPSSFLEPDLTHLLAQLAQIQTTLREVSTRSPEDAAQYLRQTRLSRPRTTGPARGSDSSGHVIMKMFEKGNPLDIDTALATTPLGPEGGRAVYWVHADAVAELRVLILRHMREQTPACSPSISRTPSAHSLAPGSRHGSVSAQPGQVDEILFDNLDAFVKEHNAATLNRTEATKGSLAMSVLMHVCWTDGSKVATTNISDVDAHDDVLGERTHHYTTHQIRKKDLDNVYGEGQTVDSVEQETSAAQEVRRWLEHHTDIRPLAHVRSRRTRFEGLQNEEDYGVWAVLQEDISMIKPDENHPFLVDSLPSPSSQFPHLVLNIRWEQQRRPEIVSMLDSSYLVERVPGFSTHAHAIYDLCVPESSVKPLWMSMIEKDIRKVPAKVSKTSLKRNLDVSGQSSKATSNSSPSSDGPGGGRFSASNLQSSATSIDYTRPEDVESSHHAKSPRKKSEQRDHPNKVRLSHQPQRYWNEFDDGSDIEGNDVYTIYVDPNASVSFPGYGTMASAAAAMRDAAKSGQSKFNSWLGLKKEGEREPLLSGRPISSSQNVDDSSDSEPLLVTTRSSRAPRIMAHRRVSSWSTQMRRQRSREAGLFRAYLGCFAAAVVLLIITCILRSTGRHKARFEVDIGVLLGVVCAMCFNITGLSMMLLRKERLSWTHRIIVSFVFVCVCVGSGFLLAFIGKAI